MYLFIYLQVGQGTMLVVGTLGIKLLIGKILGVADDVSVYYLVFNIQRLHFCDHTDVGRPPFIEQKMKGGLF